jgi:protein-S-isoprenylcysteine O-methyltransferase
LGRTACIGTVLGIIWGIHFVILVQLVLHYFVFFSFPYQTNDTNDLTTNHQQHEQPIAFMLWQWCTYVMCLCTFHLLEFFITAIYNPTQATADSYLINHSLTYTTAALLSWIEFWIRFFFGRRIRYMNLPIWISCIGFCTLIIAQLVRSLSMATAGESFNHLIQTSKRQNHILITHGIYRIFRHPSYVGFFYWSISTQLLLGNIFHTILYTAASWTFFKRRIHYEEESLCQFFPETYPIYVARTSMGIPFLKSQKHVITLANNLTDLQTSTKDH